MILGYSPLGCDLVSCSGCVEHLEGGSEGENSGSQTKRISESEIQSVQRALSRTLASEQGSEEIEVAPPLSHCPVCQSDFFQKFSQRLPMTKRSTSHLLCAASRQVLGYTNKPMALPNGYLYSGRAVAALTSDDGSKVFCLHTREAYPKKDVKRVFIV
eukprot:gb/GECG01015822.1/.p1 GENE.gb/GECG01015822.1/~~gb/GECG01015822.1/.p1  ORF type:complete len:158 (+),score=12.75 gb/GECG01015822.1/:1-474(+)